MKKKDLVALNEATAIDDGSRSGVLTALAAFAKQNNLSHDWHEPDESLVGATVVGTSLDNACGSDIAPPDSPRAQLGVQELVVVLTKDGKPVLKVNLATLLAAAAQAGLDLEGTE